MSIKPPEEQMADLSWDITNALFHSKKLLVQPPTKKQLKRKDYPEAASKVWLVETSKLVWGIMEDFLAAQQEQTAEEPTPKIIVPG